MVTDEAAAAEVGAELAETLGDVVYALRLEPDLAFEYVSTAVLDFSGHTPMSRKAGTKARCGVSGAPCQRGPAVRMKPKMKKGNTP